MYDLCVVGGGSCGMACAITAAKRGKKVIIIEKNAKLGRKLYAAGNGRCNISNTGLSLVKDAESGRRIYGECYNSSDENYVQFLISSLGAAPYADMELFLDGLGLERREQNGYVYPYSMQASSFVWALCDALRENDVHIRLKTNINSIKNKNGIFTVKLEEDELRAEKLLVACGGKSASALGGAEAGYTFAGGFGHDIIEPRPALCGLLVDEALKDIAGVRINAGAALYDEKENLYAEEEGELQITEEKISGIMIFNLAASCGKLLRAGKKPCIDFDFIPDIDEKELLSKFKSSCNRTVHGNLNSYINDKLALHIITSLGLNPKEASCLLSDETLLALIRKAKCYRFYVKGLSDFEHAQVTSGGVCLSQLDENFMSKKVDGLYFAGEVTDIDGICGGYNITYAVLSGIKVGLSI